ncbi:MAG: tail protein X [Candidatus Oceanisphaera merdipullorum]|nr:tail protein X [Candidatus Oceanisphaera merdipullorum]
MKVRTSDGDTVGQIAWRSLGRDDDEMEEQIYRLNPHLHQYLAVLPAGIIISLPEPQPTPAKEREGVWT